MNILVLSHFQSSDRYSSSSRFSGFARRWKANGNAVTLVCASFSHLYNVQPEGKGIWWLEREDGVNYLFLRTPSYQGNGIWRFFNMLSYLGLNLLLMPYYIFVVRPKIIIAANVYLLDSLLAWIIGRLTGGRMVREIRDLWPQSLIELGALHSRSVVAKVLRCVESLSFRCADGVVTTLGNGWEYVQRFGLPVECFQWIPTPVRTLSTPIDIKLISPLNARIIAALKNENIFLIGFFGSMGIGDTLPILLEAMRILKTQAIHLLVVGDGTLLKSHQLLADKYKLENVLFIPRVPREECIALMSQTDVLYLGWEDKPLYRYGISPNRLLDYQLSGRPVLHACSLHSDPVRIAGCGISVPSGDPVALADAIKEMAQMEPKELDRMGMAGLEYVLREHDESRLAQRYFEFLVMVYRRPRRK